MSPVGAYPGSFDPPTIAHLAVAAAARDRFGLTRVDLVVAEVAIGKEHVRVPALSDRVAVLEEVVAEVAWMGLVVTDQPLIVDQVDGYDVVVMGADKWHQVLDPVHYGGSTARRDAALARLPTIAVAPRPPHPVPADLALEVPAGVVGVSSTAARAGNRSVMLPAARRFDEETGAWTDPDRYLAHRPDR